MAGGLGQRGGGLVGAQHLLLTQRRLERLFEPGRGQRAVQAGQAAGDEPGGHRHPEQRGHQVRGALDARARPGWPAGSPRRSRSGRSRWVRPVSPPVDPLWWPVRSHTPGASSDTRSPPGRRSAGRTPAPGRRPFPARRPGPHRSPPQHDGSTGSRRSGVATGARPLPRCPGCPPCLRRGRPGSPAAGCPSGDGWASWPAAPPPSPSPSRPARPCSAAARSSRSPGPPAAAAPPARPATPRSTPPARPAGRPARPPEPPTPHTRASPAARTRPGVKHDQTPATSTDTPQVSRGSDWLPGRGGPLTL